MNALPYDPFFLDFHLRTQRAERRAQLLAGLEPLPRPERFRLFARRPRPILEPVEIRHGETEQARRAA